ncbi:MAG: hypothetical protein R3B09_29185 [Nannocystaceae bacterium]
MARGKLAFAGAALALLAVHLGLCAIFLHPHLWWSGEPLPGVDFHTHAHQTARVLEGLRGWGETWVYDARLLAGHPTGTLFDADNKLWELFTYALERLGVPMWTGFNLFALVVIAGVVPGVYAAARLFRLGRGAALLAAAMASALWWFDSWFHWCWWVGMIAYAGAAYFALLPLALFDRYCADRRAWQAIGCGAALGLAHLLHPYSFFILAAPMIALYVAAARGRAGGPPLRGREHAAILAIAAAPLVVNAYWLAVAATYWHYILDSAYYGQSSLAFVAHDLFEWLIDPTTTGLVGTRTMVRWMVLVAAIVALLEWRRAGDRRLRAVGVGMITLAALTYLGGYVHAVAQIQPYRHVAPLMMLATIPAAELCARGLRGRVWRRWPRSARVCALLLAIPTLQHAVSTAFYYAPPLLPAQTPMPFRLPSPIGTAGYPRQPDFRLTAPDPPASEIVDFVRAHDDGRARFLIELGPLGEMVSWSTEAHVIGGFTLRNLAHAYANLFRRVPSGALAEPDLAAYLADYAVGWIIVSPDMPWLRGYTALVEPVHRVGPHFIYRVRSPTSFVAEGGGEASAVTNKIEVRGSDPRRDLVLRFHWMETLRCAPECQVDRSPVAGDPVGFLKIPAPHPADLTIVNTYEVP